MHSLNPMFLLQNFKKYSIPILKKEKKTNNLKYQIKKLISLYLLQLIEIKIINKIIWLLKIL